MKRNNPTHCTKKGHQTHLLTLVIVVSNCTTLFVPFNASWQNVLVLLILMHFINVKILSLQPMVPIPHIKHFVEKYLQIWICILKIFKQCIIIFPILIPTFFNILGNFHFSPQIIFCRHIKHPIAGAVTITHTKHSKCTTCLVFSCFKVVI